MGRLNCAVERDRKYSSSLNPLLHTDPLKVTVNSFRLAEGECRLTLTFGVYPRLEFSEERKANIGSRAACFTITASHTRFTWFLLCLQKVLCWQKD